MILQCTKALDFYTKITFSWNEFDIFKKPKSSILGHNDLFDVLKVTPFFENFLKLSCTLPGNLQEEAVYVSYLFILYKIQLQKTEFLEVHFTKLFINIGLDLIFIFVWI